MLTKYLTNTFTFYFLILLVFSKLPFFKVRFLIFTIYILQNKQYRLLAMQFSSPSLVPPPTSKASKAADTKSLFTFFRSVMLLCT